MLDRNPPLNSPLPPAFQLPQAGMGVASFILALLSVIRSGSSQGVEGQIGGTVVCQMCKKQMPSTSKFCRRCGADLALAMLKFGPMQQDSVRQRSHIG